MEINDDGTILGVLLFIKNIIPFLLFFFGCTILYYSSESFIDKSIIISQKLKISPIIIGASVIAIGTSLPELLVSLYSVFVHSYQTDTGMLASSGIVVGNILGSNIANVALVLGFCSLLYKVIFESNVLKDLLFISFLGLYVIGCIYFDVTINYVHGICLLVSFIFYFYYLILNNQSDDSFANDNTISLIYLFLVIIIAIIGLSIGTNLIVENALQIANLLGISELNIGFSIVALGTSLPELFTALSSIKRKNYNLLIGNIIGSNIINIIFVLGMASVFTSINVNSSLISNENLVAVVFIVSHLILVLSYLINKSVSRFSGFLLLITYIFFMYNLF